MGAALALLGSIVFSLSTIATAKSVTPFLIRGTEMASKDLPEVVYLKLVGSRCSATIIGPKVVLTAAHCVQSTTTATFTHDGTKYTANFTESPLYDGYEHDLALGLTDKTIAGARPMSIGDAPDADETVLLAGYGCTKTDGTGGNDGILRAGWSKYISLTGTLLLFKDASGGAGCSGDSGGPAFRHVGKELTLTGVHSRADLNTRTLSVNLSDLDSQVFLADFAKDNKVDMCGVNVSCSAHKLPSGL